MGDFEKNKVEASGKFVDPNALMPLIKSGITYSTSKGGTSWFVDAWGGPAGTYTELGSGLGARDEQESWIFDAPNLSEQMIDKEIATPTLPLNPSIQSLTAVVAFDTYFVRPTLGTKRADGITPMTFDAFASAHWTSTSTAIVNRRGWTYSYNRTVLGAVGADMGPDFAAQKAVYAGYAKANAKGEFTYSLQ